MRTVRTVAATLFLLAVASSVAPTAQARNVDLTERLDAYFDQAIADVHATDDPAEKRTLLNEAFDDLATALRRIERITDLSDADAAALATLQADIQQQQEQLAHVPNANLDRFADQAQQQLALANRTVTLSLTTVLLILIILILLL